MVGGGGGGGGLLKYLKRPMSEHLLAVKMLNGPKHLLNL